MAKIQRAENIIKADRIILHYPHVGVPISEPFCAVRLSEYMDFGWKAAAVVTAGALHLIHPNAPYRMVA
jgi:hypothetical protein